MASETAPPAASGGPPSPAVRALLGGLAAVGVAAVWNVAAPQALPGQRALAVAGGLVAVGAALAVLLPRLRDDGESRLAAGGLWALAAAAAFVGSLAVAPSWDSVGLLFRLLAGAAAVAAVLTAVPTPWRAFLGSLLLLFHFAAIVCAITVVPPAGGAPAPFLSVQAYVRWFHPYLVVTNLNNGYHFYAPEPGPCALAWFRVQWADGASAWVRIPDHPKMANHLERRRLGALATVITQGVAVAPDRLEKLTERRTKAGEARRIPLDPNLHASAQYREPNPTGKLLLASYARFVARTTPHPDGAAAAVTGVKVYSVEYFNPPVEHFQAGREPLDPTLYAPHYMGDYDAAGAIKPESYRVEPSKDANKPPEVIQDPFLYWRVPILREVAVGPRPDGAPPPDIKPWTDEGKVVNYVRLHAGDKDEGIFP